MIKNRARSSTRTILRGRRRERERILAALEVSETGRREHLERCGLKQHKDFASFSSLKKSVPLGKLFLSQNVSRKTSVVRSRISYLPSQ
jgi:hypothetical protein